MGQLEAVAQCCVRLQRRGLACKRDGARLAQRDRARLTQSSPEPVGSALPCRRNELNLSRALGPQWQGEKIFTPAGRARQRAPGRAYRHHDGERSYFIINTQQVFPLFSLLLPYSSFSPRLNLRAGSLLTLGISIWFSVLRGLFCSPWLSHIPLLFHCS